VDTQLQEVNSVGAVMVEDAENMSDVTNACTGPILTLVEVPIQQVVLDDMERIKHAWDQQVTFEDEFTSVVSKKTKKHQQQQQ
jgi:hypothetical protein